jgi:basic membrane protein A and related proteins
MKRNRREASCFFLLVLLLLMIVIFSCRKDPVTQPAIRVAMLAQGITFDDLAFLQNCKAGLERAITDFNIQGEYNIDTTMHDYQERLAYYGTQAFDLIIAIGYMWNDALIATAQEFPEAAFVMVDTELSEPQSNAVSILFDVDEAAYPLGFLAAWWADSHGSGTPAVGFVGALEIPQIRQFTVPYRNGADRYNMEYGKNVACYGDYAGTFIVPDLGGQIADSLFSLGVDVIFGVGGQTGNGALLKAKEQGKEGIGVDVDQTISIPEVSDILISSAMKGLDKAIYAVIKSFVDAQFNGGSIYTGTLANEGVGLAPYNHFDACIPDTIKQTIEDIKARIIDGSIDTGW